MADVQTGADSNLGQNDSAEARVADKRLSSDAGDAPPKKKISMSFGPKPVGGNKIAFNLSSSGSNANSVGSTKLKTAAPIKMSIGTIQKSKEPPPIVQKSAMAAKVFDDSSDEDEEEMPPEAKMRMKNVGRETPTASGPNSYGKGKQGFVDRHKVIEKQLKEEMDKVSGDKEDGKA